MGSASVPAAAGADRGAHASPHRDRVPVWTLWGGLFGGPLCWAVQLIVTYSLVAHSCFPQADPLGVPLVGGTWGLAFGVSVIALLGTGAAGMLALRGWRATRDEKDGEAAHLLHNADGRSRFMAISGLILSALFAGAVVTTMLPLFMLRPCQ